MWPSEHVQIFSPQLKDTIFGQPRAFTKAPSIGSRKPGSSNSVHESLKFVDHSGQVFRYGVIFNDVSPYRLSIPKSCQAPCCYRSRAQKIAMFHCIGRNVCSAKRTWVETFDPMLFRANAKLVGLARRLRGASMKFHKIFPVLEPTSPVETKLLPHPWLHDFGRHLSLLALLPHI